MNKSQKDSLEEEPIFCYAALPASDFTNVVRYEIKFLLDEVGAQRVRDWAMAHLTLDVHTTNIEAGTYKIKTLYLDDERKSVYWRRGRYRHDKLRLRGYGNESVIFLERKSRWRNKVEKYRTVIPQSDLALLASWKNSTAWPGSWFHQRILRDGLKPTYQVAYERSAYVGPPDEVPMRLTMDRDIACRPARWWTLGDFGGIPLLQEKVILELKYCDTLPSPFQDLIRSFGLKQKRISKYRLAVQASERINREGQLWLPYEHRSISSKVRDEVTSF